MMGAPFPPVPNVISVQIRGTIQGGEVWENVFYTQYSGTVPTGATLATMANSWQVAWAQNMAAETISVNFNTAAICTDLSSNTGAQGQSLLSTAGTRGDDPIGASSAALISYPVQLRYRGGKPRQYLLVGGFADLADPWHWTAAFTQEYRDHWTNFLNAVIGQTFSGTTVTQHVLVRRHGKFLPNTGNGGPNTPPYVLTTPIVVPIAANSAVGHSQLASQKGRIGRRSK